MKFSVRLTERFKHFTAAKDTLNNIKISYEATDEHTVDDVGSVTPKALVLFGADDAAALHDRPNPAKAVDVAVEVVVRPKLNDAGTAEVLDAIGVACEVPKDAVGTDGVAPNA
jgi:hypothetical protein